jgi:hypothetical protein
MRCKKELAQNLKIEMSLLNYKEFMGDCPMAEKEFNKLISSETRQGVELINVYSTYDVEDRSEVEFFTDIESVYKGKEHNWIMSQVLVSASDIEAFSVKKKMGDLMWKK